MNDCCQFVCYAYGSLIGRLCIFGRSSEEEIVAMETILVKRLPHQRFALVQRFSKHYSLSEIIPNGEMCNSCIVCLFQCARCYRKACKRHCFQSSWNFLFYPICDKFFVNCFLSCNEIRILFDIFSEYLDIVLDKQYFISANLTNSRRSHVPNPLRSVGEKH
ncbi:hypothetical protein T02_15364 [Trichinella nativa]|uniref:Uncharacterized protein n=1 Tax=Trichinella nativa TaxID=6335 RepID=A0A0V1LUS1_9BILA|nr:hypothetical protein T02_15364 [Trichinella nativa]